LCNVLDEDRVPGRTNHPDFTMANRNPPEISL
jgi:hypothetical protein